MLPFGMARLFMLLILTSLASGISAVGVPNSSTPGSVWSSLLSASDSTVMSGVAHSSSPESEFGVCGRRSFISNRLLVVTVFVGVR
uniref:Putative secreted peptide n=1 Tax=Anopheles braziliensis TaxID=58242 RepID=A0A2M3ZVH1_9DIPT